MNLYTKSFSVENCLYINSNQCNVNAFLYYVIYGGDEGNSVCNMSRRDELCVSLYSVSPHPSLPPTHRMKMILLTGRSTGRVSGDLQQWNTPARICSLYIEKFYIQRGEEIDRGIRDAPDKIMTQTSYFTKSCR